MGSWTNAESNGPLNIKGVSPGKNWSINVNRKQKEEVVSELSQIFSNSGVVVVAHYAGLTVAQMSDLRNQMRHSDAGVRVAKNRLSKIALEGQSNSGLKEFLEGQTVLLYSEDPVTAAKVAVKFSKDNESLAIIGGSVGDDILDFDGVTDLAKMPSREELLGSIVGCIGSPSSEIVTSIGSPGMALAGAVVTVEEKMAV